MFNFRAQVYSTDKMAVFDISSNPREKSTFLHFFAKIFGHVKKKQYFGKLF